MLSKITRYGALNNIDAWKCFAIITMLVDHIGLFFFPENLYLRSIGRLSAPIWFFFAGMHFDKGNTRLLFLYGIAMSAILSLIKQEPDYTNILISIILIKYLVRFIDQNQLQQRVAYVEFGILWLGFTLIFLTHSLIEYGSIGFLFAYCGYLHKAGHSPIRITAFFSGTIIAYILDQQAVLGHYSLPLLLTALALLPLMTLLYRFKFQTYEFNSSSVNLIKFLSRYSLEIYFLHFIIFTIIKVCAGF